MAGPIEFASDGPVDDKGPTEFGGLAGLIQDHPDVVLTGSDKRGLIVRAESATKVDVLTGLVTEDEGANAVDPVTGREVEPDWNEDGATAPRAVDPLKTGDPTSGVL